MNSPLVLPEKLIAFSERRTAHNDLSQQLAFGANPTEPPDVTVVIPIHNQVHYTFQCLASLARHPQKSTYEVLIIDDQSDLDVFHVLAGVPGLRVVRNFANLGFVRACNRGAFLARGRYIVLLNNDTEVTDGWLDALISVFRNHPDAGLVGSKLVYPDGTLQEAGGICWNDGSAWNFGRNQDPSRPEFNYLRETDYCSGACIALPAELWHRLRGFDDVYAPAYYEDTDLAFRVREAGYRVYFQPRSVVVHHEGKSNGTDIGSGIKQYQERNRSTFLERWRPVLAAHRPNAVDVFRARERSFSRKVILIIDHYVPHPDKDAGSRNVMSYIRFFLKQGFSVKFIGDNFFPHQPYTEQLQELGVEVLVGNHFALTYPQWLAEHGSSIDYVLLSRAHIACKWVSLVREHTHAPILFYGHDLLSRTQMRAYQRFREHRYLEEAQRQEIAERAVFDRVDWVFYPSSEEIAVLQERFPSIRAGRLPLYTFKESERDVPTFEQRSGILFVGGFGHHPNLDAMLWFANDVLPEIQRHVPSLRLSIAGSNPPAEILALQNRGVAIHPNVSDDDLKELYRSHRLAIVPLRYGGGIKGKMLEAMFLGTPVVATPIAAEGLAWTDTHFLCRGEDELGNAVAKAYTQPDVWRTLQQNAWSFIAEQYSEDALIAALVEAIPDLNTSLATSPEIPALASVG